MSKKEEKKEYLTKQQQRKNIKTVKCPRCDADIPEERAKSELALHREHNCFGAKQK